MLLHIFDSDKISGDATDFRVHITLPPGTVYKRVRLVKALFTPGAVPPAHVSVALTGLGITNSYGTDVTGGAYVLPIIGSYDLHASNDAAAATYVYVGTEPHAWVKITDFTAAILGIKLQVYTGGALTTVDSVQGVSAAHLVLEFEGDDDIHEPRA